jgi:hypothetical protein
VATRDVGDRLNLQYLVYNSAGVLTNATVVLTVTDPSGDVTTPTVTNSATGTYDASFTLSEAGTWTWKWAASGAVVDVDYGSVFAVDPSPGVYASVPDLKSTLGLTDTSLDPQLADCLDTASRWIDQYCDRIFYAQTTATAKYYHPRDAYCVLVDDFWTTTGLVLATDTGDGTYSTTWASTDYVLEPANPVTGWPQNKVVSVNTSFTCTRRPPVKLTAKWGWPAVPTPVKQACLIIATETLKLAREAPFGVANFGVEGLIRVRDNARVLSLLSPFRRNAMLVA